MAYLKISVAGQIIAEKPESKLEGDQTNRLKNQLPIIGDKERSGPGKVAPKHLPAHIQIKGYLREIVCRFT